MGIYIQITNRIFYTFQHVTLQIYTSEKIFKLFHFRIILTYMKDTYEKSITENRKGKLN